MAVMTHTASLPDVKKSFTRSIGLLPKVIFLIALIVIAMVITEPIFLLVMLAFTILITLTSGISKARLLSSLKPLALVMALLFIFTSLTYDPSNAVNDYARTVIFHIADWGIITLQLTTGGLVFGSVFVLKLLLMMFGSVYVIGSTPMEEILAGLNKLHAPAAVGLMAMIVFRFMPTMLDEVDAIKDAQRARGAGAKLAVSENSGKKRKSKAVKGTIPLFVPMIVSSMRKSDTLAMSMVSRGFGYTKRPTPLMELKSTPTDLFVSAVIAVFLVAVLVLRYSQQFGVL